LQTHIPSKKLSRGEIIVTPTLYDEIDHDEVYPIWKERMETLGFKDESETTVEECKKWLISQVEEMW
jgi:hypothetical protein